MIIPVCTMQMHIISVYSIKTPEMSRRQGLRSKHNTGQIVISKDCVGQETSSITSTKSATDQELVTEMLAGSCRMPADHSWCRRRSTLGDWAFSVAAARDLNALPQSYNVFTKSCSITDIIQESS